jgi:hypothetical protein
MSLTIERTSLKILENGKIGKTGAGASGLNLMTIFNSNGDIKEL